MDEPVARDIGADAVCEPSTALVPGSRLVNADSRCSGHITRYPYIGPAESAVSTQRW